jgi:CBS domain-containing protein
MSTSASSFAQARVADVMHGPVITCGPETPIQLVAKTMADENVHAVVVTGIERTAWGVVTALDVATASATEAIDDVARDVAVTEPVTVSADTPLSEAARVMAEHQVNHLLVADADGRPAGIVSTTDVARHFAATE